MGPNFKPPAAPKDAAYLPAEPPAGHRIRPVAGGEAQRFIAAEDIPGQWWTLFQSPEMNALLEEALKHNPTLEAAQAALRQANENLAAQRGAFYPSLTGTYQVQRADASLASFGLPGSGNYLYTLNSASVNVAYTLDVFGGIRRQVEALQAQADYERSSLEASYLALTANVVTAAVTEASLRAQVAVTEEVARSQRAQLDITQRRVTAGGASRVDVLQQQATLQATLATLPALRTQLAQERDLLATYVGTLPARYDGRPFQLDALHLPQDLPVSVPSRLVEQRPDVREFSALLHEATAQVGVATANMLPQFNADGQLRRRFDEVLGLALARLGGVESRRRNHPAPVQGRAAVASAARRGGRRPASRGELPGHRAHGLSERRGQPARARRRCRGPGGADGRGTVGLRKACDWCKRSTRPAARITCRCSRPNRRIRTRRSPSSRRARNASSTPRHCSRRSAAAGGIAPTRTLPVSAAQGIS